MLHSPLKILHVFRAPVGGLFRHVLDLAHGQVAHGHRVGLVLDSNTGGTHAEQMLCGIAPELALGLSRTAMPRLPGPLDVTATRHVSQRINTFAPDVVHGHGAKGAAYVRIAASTTASAIRAYTPHGGSLHYSRGLVGSPFLSAERALLSRTDLLLFESEYARRTFYDKIGAPDAIVRVVPNGVASEEFSLVRANEDASDIVFIGELRVIKGIDLLIDAIGDLRLKGCTLTASIIGDGPDRAKFAAQAARRRVKDAIRFLPPMPARQAFAHGRLMVMPSRAESMPYVVLEAAAAGIPLVATAVGGIPEIFGPLASRLVAPDDATALAEAIMAVRANHAEALATTLAVRERVREGYLVNDMVEGVLAGYRDALTTRARTLRGPPGRAKHEEGSLRQA